MSFRVFLIAWFVFAAGASLPCRPARAESSLAERLPGDTCLAVLTGDFAELSNAFRKTNLGGVLSGQDLRPFIEELKRRDVATVLHLRPWFGVDWSELSEVSGPLAIAVFPHSKGEIGIACLWDAANAPEAKSKCLAAGEKYFSAKKFRKSVVKIADGELVVYEPPAGKKGEPARVHFAAGDLFGTANSRAAAEALLAVKAADSLAAQDQFTQLADTAGAEDEPASARLYVRPWELWSLSRGASTGGKPSARDPFVMARRQGVEAFQAVGGTLRFPADEACDTEFSLTIAYTSPLKKGMGIFELKPGLSLPIPEWLSADATSFTSWQWDFAAAMKAFGNLFDEANEPGPTGEGLFEDVLSGLRDDPEGPKIDLRRDLFARLGPRLLAVADRNGASTPKNPRGERLLMVAECRDSPRLVALFTSFYEADKRVVFKKAGNAATWTCPEGNSLFVEGENQTLLQVRAVAVTADQLLFATDPALLKLALAAEPPADSLANDKDWQALQTWLADKEAAPRAALQFLRPAPFVEAGYVQLRAGNPRPKNYLDEGLLHFLLFGTFEANKQLPYSELPPFDRLRDRLRPAAVGVTLTENGWQLRGGILK